MCGSSQFQQRFVGEERLRDEPKECLRMGLKERRLESRSKFKSGGESHASISAKTTCDTSISC